MYKVVILFSYLLSTSCPEEEKCYTYFCILYIIINLSALHLTNAFVSGAKLSKFSLFAKYFLQKVAFSI